MAFFLLVDYDNLSDLDRSRELKLIIPKLISSLDTNIVNDKNIQVRLYGGWYENNQITRKAQNLKTEIIRSFPLTLTLSDHKTTVIVNVENALSLASSPKNDLFNTFRRKGVPTGISASHPSSAGCTHLNCPTIHVFDFFDKGYCNACSNIRPENIIYRQEQKLVDTMLTTDLIDLAISNGKIGIASSDDDLWPPILHVLSKGKKVHHLLTRTTTPPPHYSKIARSNYTYKTLL